LPAQARKEMVAMLAGMSAEEKAAFIQVAGGMSAVERQALVGTMATMTAADRHRLVQQTQLKQMFAGASPEVAAMLGRIVDGLDERAARRLPAVLLPLSRAHFEVRDDAAAAAAANTQHQR
jgi:hypothetical protein